MNDSVAFRCQRVSRAPVASSSFTVDNPPCPSSPSIHPSDPSTLEDALARIKSMEKSNAAICQEYEEKLAVAAAALKAAEEEIEELKEVIRSIPRGEIEYTKALMAAMDTI